MRRAIRQQNTVLGDHAIVNTAEDSLYFRAVSGALQESGRRLIVQHTAFRRQPYSSNFLGTKRIDGVLH